MNFKEIVDTSFNVPYHAAKILKSILQGSYDKASLHKFRNTIRPNCPFDQNKDFFLEILLE